ncbi:hypothetical protein D3C84_1182520 [compost metagenome]
MEDGRGYSQIAVTMGTVGGEAYGFPLIQRAPLSIDQHLHHTADDDHMLGHPGLMGFRFPLIAG